MNLKQSSHFLVTQTRRERLQSGKLTQSLSIAYAGMKGTSAADLLCSERILGTQGQ